MNARKNSCTYTAQGLLVCRRNTLIKPSNEGFEGCGISKAFKECANDDECMDPSMSCRIMPVSVNSTQKVCMPDDVQYATRTLLPF